MKRERPLVAVLILLFSAASALWASPKDSLPEPVAVDPAPFQAALADLWATSPAPVDRQSLAELWSSGPAPVLDMSFAPAYALAQAEPAATDANTAASDETAESAVPEDTLQGLLNNEYYKESLKLKKMAEDSFDYGDYDASGKYAAEAAAAAAKSDEYVALRLKILEVDAALSKAKEKLDWAASVGAERTYAKEYAAASDSYKRGMDARAAEDYDLALQLAKEAVASLASVRDIPPLPAKYKVRPWSETRDCFWNISAYPWVYGDPTKWKVLYEANKAKLPRPEDPNLLRVGTILTIPSLRGEIRDGTWEKGKTYQSLPGR